MPHLCTIFCRGTILVQKDTLLCTELAALRFPVQEMPHLCTIFGRGAIFGAGKHSFLHHTRRATTSGAGNASFVHQTSREATFGAGRHSFLHRNGKCACREEGGMKCPVACHFGRKCRLVNNLNGNGVKCVCLKHKNGGKNEQLQWTE